MSDIPQKYTQFFDSMQIPRFIVERGEDKKYSVTAINALSLDYFDLSEDQIAGKKLARSMEMSMRWGDRCLKEFERHDNGAQGLYGIIQGGVHSDLRKISAEYTKDRPFFGTAVGGCLGGSDEEMETVVGASLPFAHPDRPIHFLGIGQIKDVFRFVRMGVDTFDCVIPTRLARHGSAFIKGQKGETINLKNAKYREDHTPLDENNAIPASTDFTKAYIHHLLKAGEMLGMQILAQHNVATINRLMREIRAAIRDGALDDLEKEWLPK